MILAEGAWAESYIDDDNRSMFHNAHEFAELYPDEPPALAIYYAPRIEAGPALEATGSEIDRRDGLNAMEPKSLVSLRGQLDYADHRVIYR